MRKEITPELQTQIEQEADAITAKLKDNTDYQAGYSKGYEDGYIAAGGKYGIKWTAAEQRAERYEKALKLVQQMAKNGIFPHLPVETMGAQMCIEIDRHITDFLTPKSSTDE
jgi:hypothetical protein